MHCNMDHSGPAPHLMPTSHAGRELPVPHAPGNAVLCHCDGTDDGLYIAEADIFVCTRTFDMEADRKGRSADPTIAMQYSRSEIHC